MLGVGSYAWFTEGYIMNEQKALLEDLEEKKTLLLIDDLIDWAAKENPTEVDQWLKFCGKILISWGWDKSAIRDYLEWGKYGFNNEMLHFETQISEFYSEVLYCSDRMSMDRLFRCHSFYRNLVKDVK